MGQTFKLPELGENIHEIRVTSIRVKPGDSIAAGQVVFEMETDKATVEVPVDVGGVVERVLVAEGDEVTVAQPLLELAGENKGVDGPVEAVSPVSQRPGSRAGADRASSAGAADALARAQSSAGVPLQESADGISAPPPTEPTEVGQSRQAATPYDVPAAPAARRVARELQVDVTRVAGSGPGGRVSVADVRAHAGRLRGGPAAGGPGEAEAAEPAAPAAPAQWGPVERKRMSVIRRRTAEHMARCWSRVPHVTIFDSADITELDVWRRRYAGRAEQAGGKLTMAVMVCKVAAVALKRFPRFNASVDMAAEEIVIKPAINLGVAVNTERGLVVPVIRDADRKNMVDLAVEIGRLAQKARDGKITLDDLTGGTFTVTNLGRICGTFFTPIVNEPEVAILGIGRAEEQAVVRDGQVQVRMRLPLSLSFDHRAVDGADGALFLRRIIDAIEQPLLLSLEG